MRPADEPEQSEEDSPNLLSTKNREREESPMGNSTASAAAEAAMADIFTGMLMSGGLTFASFERSALTEGHAIMARAMGRALERPGAALCAEPPPPA